MGENNPEGSAFDGSYAAMDRMQRAHKRGTGCHLTAEMIASLSLTTIGELWNAPDPDQRVPAWRVVPSPDAES